MGKCFCNMVNFAAILSLYAMGDVEIVLVTHSNKDWYEKLYQNDFILFINLSRILQHSLQFKLFCYIYEIHPMISQ